ncbi:MAG: hypothetical protein WCP28_06100 [Actinomycetes bacterium]
MGFSDAASDKAQAKVSDLEAQVASLTAQLSKAKAELSGAQAIDQAVDTVTSPDKIKGVAQPVRDKTDSLVASATAKVAKIQAELTTVQAKLNMYQKAQDVVDYVTEGDDPAAPVVPPTS